MRWLGYGKASTTQHDRDDNRRRAETLMFPNSLLGPKTKLPSVVDGLHATAAEGTGLSNFGDTAYREGLRTLLEAYENDRLPTMTGRQLICGSVLRILRARLLTQKGWSDHPEVLRTRIQQPLIITGLPRSGTTALHRLMSMDPQFQGIQLWLSYSPMIRPPRSTWAVNPEYQRCKAHIDMLNDRMPDLRKAHTFAADEIEECTTILMHNFTCRAWIEVANLPTYADWLAKQNTLGTYVRYADTLRLMGAHESEKRWLLKSPHHLGEADKLLELFPDACIVQTHRDPLEAIPSLCSLLHMLHQASGDDVSPSTVITDAQCRSWSNALERMNLVRERSPHNFFDVDHRCFTADPLGTVSAVYRFLGLQLTSAAKSRMEAWVAQRPTLKHGQHAYKLDCWGLDDTQLRQTFSDYRERHQFI